MDSEKVIGHLLIIRTWNEVGKAYAHDEMDKREKAKTVEWIDETLELLKEQEAVPAIQREVMHMLVWCCGSCGVGITHGDKFCRMCGRSVKWE